MTPTTPNNAPSRRTEPTLGLPYRRADRTDVRVTWTRARAALHLHTAGLKTRVTTGVPA